ncbi:MAG: LAO/AO transport system ATPase [Bacteroidetes bacterium]|nr:MAG: LAO/AO transport system ATPase [Bacteroidota bacterium]
MSTTDLIKKFRSGDFRALARCITLVENELEGSEEILASLNFEKPSPLVGVTGPPGAGKSTLISELIRELAAQGKKVAVIAVDPTSPFNFGSLLGDRLRMNEHFDNPNVFIRSLATRGSLGGLSAKSIEISDVVRNAGFDLVILETVGVGQSEVEIAGLADTTVLVLVPEGGDDVQALKSGIMEVADIFVVNKSDRPGANTFAKNITELLHGRKSAAWNPPVIRASATKREGIAELLEQINAHHALNLQNERRSFLLAEKAWRLVSQLRMKDMNKSALRAALEKQFRQPGFNLYAFVRQFVRPGL